MGLAVNWDWALRKKKKDLLKALENNVDIKKIRQQSIMVYGLVDNVIRQTVWPMLAKVQDEPEEIDPRVLETHPSRKQVLLDTSRMVSLLPSGLSDADILHIKECVTRLILSVLIDNPSLHYYQGFHDVCYIFYSVLGEKKSHAILNKLVPTHFGIFMQETMDVTLEYMELIFALLGCVCPRLLENIETVGLRPDFAISWIITWFTHVLPNMDDVRRLFDLILATDSIMLIYLSVSIIISSDRELDSTPKEFDHLFHTLAHLPKLHPVEELVRRALQIFIDFPPHTLLEVGDARIQKRRDHLAQMNDNRLRRHRKHGPQVNYANWMFTQWRYSNKKFVLGFTGALVFSILGYVLFQRTV